MVVRYLYIGRSIVPVKHKAVLVVDSDGPLAGAVALEPVEPCPRVVSQVVQRGHRVQNVEPAFGLGLDALETSHPLVKPNSLCIPVRERPYRHGQYVIRYPYMSRISLGHRVCGASLTHTAISHKCDQSSHKEKRP